MENVKSEFTITDYDLESFSSSHTFLKPGKVIVRPGFESLLNIPSINVEEKLIEDPRLAKWEHWMNERKKQHKHLGKKLKRSAGSLLMNSIEEVRTIIEEKQIIEYTNILSPPDPQRGSPAFWNFPNKLVTIPWLPSEYYCQMTAEIKCVIPEIECVAVPTLIQEHKEVIGRSSKSRAVWENSTYRQKRVQDLRRNILKIQEYKPQMNDLILIGTPYNQQLPQEPQECIVPIITISEYAEHLEYPRIEQYDLSFPVLALRINDILLNKNIKKDVKIELTFDCVMDRPHTYTEQVKMTNEGLATLRYNWKQKLTHNPDLPVLKRHWIFFFDKNENLILPGQTVVLEFHFKPLCTGTSSQMWEMVLVPNVLEKPATVIFRLWANVNKYDYPEVLNHIDHFIKQRVENTKIEKRVEKMWQSLINYHKESIVTETLTEKEYFYSANFDKNTQLSKYPFQINVIEKLKLFYECVKSPSCPQTWDLCIDSITNAISKHNNFKEQNEMYEYLQNIIYPLMYHPIDVINPEYRKHKLVYNILATTIDIIENEARKYIFLYGFEQFPTNYPTMTSTYQKMHLWEDSVKKHYCETPQSFYTCVKRRAYSDKEKNITMPPNYYPKRDDRLISLDPMERHLLLKQLLKEETEQATNKRQLAQQRNSVFESRYASADHTIKNRSRPTLDKLKLSHTASYLTKSDKLMADISLKPDRLIADNVSSHIELHQSSELQQNEYLLDKENVVIFKDILYIKTYFHLMNAIDNITAIIDFCRINYKETPLPVIKTIVDCEHEISEQYSDNTESE